MFGFAGKKAAGYAVAKIVGRANPYVSAVMLAAQAADAAWNIYQVGKNIHGETRNKKGRRR